MVKWLVEILSLRSNEVKWFLETFRPDSMQIDGDVAKWLMETLSV